MATDIGVVGMLSVYCLWCGGFLLCTEYYVDIPRLGGFQTDLVWVVVEPDG